LLQLPFFSIAIFRLIDAHHQATSVTGLFAAITPSYRSEKGGVTVELQLIGLNRRLASDINKAARNSG